MDDLSKNRGYPLPHPQRSAAVDASRLRAGMEMLDADMANLLQLATQPATLEALGRVVMITAAQIAAGDPTGVPSGAAVQNYVRVEFERLAGAAPDALDTLASISAALNNDPDFAATITSQLAEKADRTVVEELVTGVGDALDAKADKVPTEEALSDRYTKSEVDIALTGKQNVNSAIQLGRWTICDPGNNNIDFRFDGTVRFFVQHDGNIHLKSFGYLNSYVADKCTAVSDWVYSAFVNNIRLTGGSTVACSGTSNNIGGTSGEVITKVWGGGAIGVFYFQSRFLQKLVNGTWYTCATV